MYTIGDFLIQIKNAYMARKRQAEFSFSNAIAAIGKILEKEGYIETIKEKAVNKKKRLIVTLRYEGKLPAISEIKLISKPSAHHYINKSQIKKFVTNSGISILSTSKGVMSSRDAQKKGIGGELICQIY